MMLLLLLFFMHVKQATAQEYDVRERESTFVVYYCVLCAACALCKIKTHGHTC